jgi:nicotinate phosphoribosyltransferase
MMKEDWDTLSFDFDIDGIRKGYYTDTAYINTVSILSTLAHNKYVLTRTSELKLDVPFESTNFNVGDAVVETHWIARRQPFTILAGMPKVLKILRECTGYFDDSGIFVNTASSLEVEALADGELISYDGYPTHALPILIIRGRYRDFALLKTPILGTLARASRIATNVYRILEAARGKRVYFFAPRYDPFEIQPVDGYAYHIAVRRFNKDRGTKLPDEVATFANAEWWGGKTAGTIPHEAIACFLGDLAELMIKFAEVLPLHKKRVALVDFHNDCVNDTRRILWALFKRYKACIEAKELESAMRYKLHGIRIDTSSELVDKSLSDPEPSDYGPRGCTKSQAACVCL